MSLRITPRPPRPSQRTDSSEAPARAATTARAPEVKTSAPVDRMEGTRAASSAPATPQAAAPARAPAAQAPQKKGFFDRLGDAVGGLVTGLGSAIVGAARNVGEAVGTFFGGIGRIFKGDVPGGLGQMGLGLIKGFVQTPVDALLMLGGRAISGVQTLLGLEPPGRKLSDTEIAALKKVYGDSIDYARVRIKEGDSGLLSISGRAFAHGDTLYIPPGDVPLQTDLLVHEMGHVWQHQNGGTDYLSEALWAQNFGDGYDFEKALKEGKPWSEMNPEQQAEFLQQAYRSGYFDKTPGRFTYNGVDYTKQLEAALKQVRAGQGAP